MTLYDFRTSLTKTEQPAGFTLALLVLPRVTMTR